MADYFGLIEMVFSFGLILGLGLWQLWALEKAKKKLRDDQTQREGEP